MIKVVNKLEFSELEQRIREVPLLNSPAETPLQPYKNAAISIREIAYTDIRPTTLYALAGNLAFQRQFTVDLAEAGHHPLELEYGLELVSDAGEPFGLLPPMVEEAPEGLCLIDGIHRNFEPRLLGRTTFSALCIENADPDYPIYAYPNGWDEIVVYDEVPPDPSLKKRYRVENPYDLYRDISGLAKSAPRSA